MPDEVAVIDSDPQGVIPASTLSEDHWTHDHSFDDASQKIFSKYGTQEEAFSAHVSLAQHLGNSITLPKDDATDAEKTTQIDKIYTKLGVPDNEAGYKFEMPKEIPTGMEPSAEAMTEFKKLGISLKLTDTQMAGLAKFDMDKTIRNMEAGQAAQAKAKENEDAEKKAANDKALGELKEDWGEEFDNKVAKAALAYEKYGPKDPAARTRDYYQVYLDKMSEDVLVTSQGQASKSGKPRDFSNFYDNQG